MAYLLLRLVLGYLLTLVVVMQFPGIWLRPLAPVSAVIADLASPYFANVRAYSEGVSIHVQGDITLDMTLLNGQPLPPLPGKWHKNGSQSLGVLLVALPIWLAISLPRRRKMLALVCTCLIALAGASFDFAVETQHAALQGIGTQWLPAHTMENTPANIESFARLESNYRTSRVLKAFFDGGGRLFLGVLAGWMGFQLSGFQWSNRPRFKSQHAASII